MSDYGDIQIAGAQDNIRTELISSLSGAQPLDASPGESRLLVPPYSLAWAAEFLLYRGARLALHTIRQDKSGAFFVIAVFDLGPHKGFFSIEAMLDAKRPTYPSLAAKIPAAHWAEREAHDLFGVVPEGHPSPAHLIVKEQHPLRREFRVEASKPLSFLPPSNTHDTGDALTQLTLDPLQKGARYSFASDGEVILRCEAQHFLGHRGAEKQAEGATFEQAVAISERICIDCSAANAYSLCAAFERIRGTLAPPRARSLRVVALELERISVHAKDLARLCEALALYSAQHAALSIKERIHRLSALLFGHRFLMNLFVPGGLRKDPTPDKLRSAATELSFLTDDLGQLMKAFDKSPGAIERLQEIAVLDVGLAQELGAVGVIGRASGIDYDVRRDHPYDGYQDIEAPQVFCESVGDAATRLKLRVLELKESLQLLARLLGKDLPTGPVFQELGALPEGASAVGYAEAAHGENVTYVMLGPKNTIQRYRLRSASYQNALALPSSCVGTTFDDFPIIEHSFALCTACIDR